jgi:3-oxoacyl-[acyl-carrier protein] reductase
VKGKHALVTGASGDIGRAVVRRLVDEGAAVVAHRHRSGIDSGAEHVVAADLTAPTGPRDLLDALPPGWDGLDLLVNCVGGAAPVRFGDVTDEDWSRCLDVNLTAPFRVLRAALGHLTRARGAVVNVTSVAALTGGSFGPHYAAAKAGLIGLTRSAARELGGRGIRVNAVAPGPVESRMTDQLNPDQLAALLNATALGRVVHPAEVADAVLWLAGAEAVTGQTMVVDGGRCFL